MLKTASMSGFGGDQEGKAQQYIADGEKVLKKWTLFSSTTKNEDAAECFNKAARCYKASFPFPCCWVVILLLLLLGRESPKGKSLLFIFWFFWYVCIIHCGTAVRFSFLFPQPSHSSRAEAMASFCRSMVALAFPLLSPYCLTSS